MKSSLIIEASDRLAWHKRLASEASTAALWGGWLWLWAPLLKGASSLALLGPQFSPSFMKALPAAAGNLPLSLAAIAGTSGTLMAWHKLPRQRAHAPESLPVAEYARRFEVSERVIEQGREASVCVVHHDAEGRISLVECRAPATQAAA
ncbi:MAG: poly-beta-1,6-N-acetyl-D-glucosamine biosynthesis protein PgaD [Anaeromyxobacter sp.]